MLALKSVCTATNRTAVRSQLWYWITAVLSTSTVKILGNCLWWTSRSLVWATDSLSLTCILTLSYIQVLWHLHGVKCCCNGYINTKRNGFKNVFLRCPTPRLHFFLPSHWPSCRFLSFMAFPIPSIQFFFGLPRALFYFGIHLSAILGNLPSAILWTWPYHVSCFC